MGEQTQHSSIDETLSVGLYTGSAPITAPQVLVAHFEYSSRRRSFLDRVDDRYGEALRRPLPPEHVALLQSGSEQSPDDISLASSPIHAPVEI